MWPMVLDMSRDECKRMLRRLELEAYSAIVSAFRAQGDLGREKKKMLQDLCSTLSISNERHRAEIRRAVNDERLNTIADRMVGPNTQAEWAIEGRRLIPLLPRLVPQTAFTAVANRVANMTAAQNAQMPTSSATSQKQVDATSPMVSPALSVTPAATPSCSISLGTNVPSFTRQSLSPELPSPTCSTNTFNVGTNIPNVGGSVTPSLVMLPSGMAVHIKDHPLLNQAESFPDEDANQKRRIAAIDISNLAKMGIQSISNTSSSLQFPKVSSVASSSCPSRNVMPLGATPMKITLTSSSVKSTSTLTSSPAQKVILVSGSTLNTSLLQRSLSVPIVKTVTATGTTISVTQPKTTSLVMPGSSCQTLLSSASQPSAMVTSIGSLGSMITMASSASSTSTATVSVGSTVPTICMTGSSNAINKHRVRQKGKTNLVPVSTQPLPKPNQSIQIKPLAMMKPSIQIKNESAVKIIAQALPLSGSTKILPKPLITTSPPMMVGTSSSAITVMTKTIPSMTTASQTGTRVVNVIASQGARLANGSHATKASSSTPTIITVTPQNLQATAVKMAAAAASGRLMGSSNLADAVSSPATGSALLMVRPKNMPTATIKVISSTRAATGDGTLVRNGQPSGKPNVIVVQKAQMMSQPSLGTTFTLTPGNSSASQTIVETMNSLGTGTPLGKELLSFLQRPEKVKTVTIQPVSSARSNSLSVLHSLAPVSVDNRATHELSLSSSSLSSSSLQLENSVNLVSSSVLGTGTISQSISKSPVTGIVTAVDAQVQVRDEKENIEKNTVLADILQATGILTEDTSQTTASVSSTDVPISTAEEEVEEEPSSSLQDAEDFNKQLEADSQTVYQLNDWNTQAEMVIPTSVKETSEHSVHTDNVLPYDILSSSGKVSSVTLAVLQQAGIDVSDQVPSSSDAACKESKSEISNTNLDEKALPRKEYRIPLTEAIHNLPAIVGAQTTNSGSKESDSQKDSPVVDKKETIGELDPQTGIFYPLTKLKDNQLTVQMNKSISSSSKPDSNEVISSSQPQSSLDIFSTAIASAQLDLNPFQFTEEDLIHIQESVISQNDSNVETVVTTSSTSSKVPDDGADGVEETLVSDVTGDVQLLQEGRTCDASEEVSASFGKSSQEPSSSLIVNHSKSIPSITRVTVVKMPSFIKLENDSVNLSSKGTNNTSTTFVETVQQAPSNESSLSSNHHEHEMSKPDSTVDTPQEETTVPKTDAFKPIQQCRSSVTNVMVEPSQFDTSTMTVEDFTSQKLQGDEFIHDIIDEVVLDITTTVHDEGEATAEEAEMDTVKSNGSTALTLMADQSNSGSSSGIDSLEQLSDSAVRTSKRKRKAPLLPDESPPHLTGWGRLAMGILQKVSTYRGKNRAKGTMNAADWFLRPVSPTLAPGYHKVVKKPMDFSTIKRNLEMGHYNDLLEFNGDMMLIKKNCELYNPSTHPARMDCTEVFSFYQQEYKRVVDKWQKARVCSTSPKKVKSS